MKRNNGLNNHSKNDDLVSRAMSERGTKNSEDLQKRVDALKNFETLKNVVNESIKNIIEYHEQQAQDKEPRIRILFSDYGNTLMKTLLPASLDQNIGDKDTELSKYIFGNIEEYSDKCLRIIFSNRHYSWPKAIKKQSKTRAFHGIFRKDGRNRLALEKNDVLYAMPFLAKLFGEQEVHNGSIKGVMIQAVSEMMQQEYKARTGKTLPVDICLFDDKELHARDVIRGAIASGIVEKVEWLNPKHFEPKGEALNEKEFEVQVFDVKNADESEIPEAIKQKRNAEWIREWFTDKTQQEQDKEGVLKRERAETEASVMVDGKKMYLKAKKDQKEQEINFLRQMLRPIISDRIKKLIQQGKIKDDTVDLLVCDYDETLHKSKFFANMGQDMLDFTDLGKYIVDKKRENSKVEKRPCIPFVLSGRLGKWPQKQSEMEEKSDFEAFLSQEPMQSIKDFFSAPYKRYTFGKGQEEETTVPGFNKNSCQYKLQTVRAMLTEVRELFKAETGKEPVIRAHLFDDCNAHAEVIIKACEENSCESIHWLNPKDFELKEDGSVKKFTVKAMYKKEGETYEQVKEEEKDSGYIDSLI